MLVCRRQLSVMCDALELQGAIGFSGKVNHSLILHPSDKHIIYPLGSTIVIRNVEDQSDQTFLQAHTQRVTCISISNCGNYLASGQVIHMGYLADVILWDISGIASGSGAKPTVMHKLSLHKVRVQAVAFSCNGKYLASIGGEDDNNLVIWDVESGMAICGSPASHDAALTCKWLNCSETSLVTGGIAQLRVWDFDPTNRKVRPTECNLGKEKRSFTSIVVSGADEAIYCGTMSGDVVKIDTLSKRLVKTGPRRRFMQGIHAITINPATNELLIGSGDGEIAVLCPESLVTKSHAKVLGGVTSLALDSHGEFFFTGTAQSNVYLVQFAGLHAELKGTNHPDQINDIAFPKSYSDLFATCAGSDIRVWHSRSMSELLRIQVPNLECNCIAFPTDGSAIISGWSDGKIRSFGPQSGNLQYVVDEAHKLTGAGNSSGGVVPKNGVTSICPSNDGRRLLSGGADGKVRVWAVSQGQQVMLASMQEHKGPISAISIKADDSECVSASADGSCIVWALAGLHPFVRVSALFAANFFKSVVYFPDESQLLTCGTDRKITYWDVTNMTAIRIVDGSESAEVTALHINKDGRYFVSGSSDKKVTLWNYDEGSKYYEGEAHSGGVTTVRVSPDERTIVSAGTEGAICIWRIPDDFAH